MSNEDTNKPEAIDRRKALIAAAENQEKAEKQPNFEAVANAATTGDLRAESATEICLDKWDGTTSHELENRGNDKVAIFNIKGEIQPGSQERFIKSLNEVPETASAIEVRIHSPGGSWQAGREIYVALAKHDKHHIVGRVVGECSSAASMILQGCTERIIESTGRVMIHKISPNIQDAKNLEANIATAEALSAQLYADSNTAGLTAEGYSALIEDGDYYMTAEQAVKQGFADSVSKVSRLKNKQYPVVTLDGEELDIESLTQTQHDAIQTLSAKRKKNEAAGDLETDEGEPKPKTKTPPEEGAENGLSNEEGTTDVLFNAWLKQTAEMSEEQFKALDETAQAGFTKLYNQFTDTTGSGAKGGDGATEKGGTSLDLKNAGDEATGILANIKKTEAKLELMNAKAELTEKLSDEKYKELRSLAFERLEDGRPLSNELLEAKMEAIDNRDEYTQHLELTQKFTPIQVDKLESNDQQKVMEMAYILSLQNAMDSNLKDRQEYLIQLDQSDPKKYRDAGLQPLMLGVDSLLSSNERRKNKKFEDYTEQHVDLATRMNRDVGGDGFGLTNYAAWKNGRHFMSAQPLGELSNSSTTRVDVIELLRKSCQWILIAGYQESSFKFRDFVRILPNQSYKEQQRYRWYAKGKGMQKTPAGASIEKGLELKQVPSYKTRYERYSMAFNIDECWFDSGNDDFGPFAGILNSVLDDANVEREKMFWEIISENTQGNEEIALSRETWRAIVRGWRKCQRLDPDHPRNAEDDCNFPRFNEVPKPQLLLNGCYECEFDELLLGDPWLCGDGGVASCEVRHLRNTLSSKVDHCYTDRIDDCSVVILPQASPEVHGIVMALRGTQEVPTVQMYEPTCKDYLISAKITDYMGMFPGEERWIKSGKDVNEWVAKYPPKTQGSSSASASVQGGHTPEAT